MEIETGPGPHAELDQVAAGQQFEHHHLAFDQGRGGDRLAAGLAQAGHGAAHGAQNIEAVTHCLAEHHQLDGDLVAFAFGLLAHIAASDQGAQMAMGPRLGDAQLAGDLADPFGPGGGGEVFDEGEDQVHRRQGALGEGRGNGGEECGVGHFCSV